MVKEESSSNGEVEGRDELGQLAGLGWLTEKERRGRVVAAAVVTLMVEVEEVVMVVVGMCQRGN